MNWLKRLFPPRASTDAPLDVANETSDEIDINEARIDAGGGGAMTGTDAAGVETDQAVEDELSEYEDPSA